MSVTSLPIKCVNVGIHVNGDVSYKGTERSLVIARIFIFLLHCAIISCLRFISCAIFPKAKVPFFLVLSDCKWYHLNQAVLLRDLGRYYYEIKSFLNFSILESKRMLHDKVQSLLMLIYCKYLVSVPYGTVLLYVCTFKCSKAYMY